MVIRLTVRHTKSQSADLHSYSKFLQSYNHVLNTARVHLFSKPTYVYTHVPAYKIETRVHAVISYVQITCKLM